MSIIWDSLAHFNAGRAYKIQHHNAKIKLFNLSYISFLFFCVWNFILWLSFGGVFWFCVFWCFFRLFKECPHPDEKQRLELSRRLNLETRQVKFWFQNRRTQMKVTNTQHQHPCAITFQFFQVIFCYNFMLLGLWRITMDHFYVI